MIKQTLALLAVGATATHISQRSQDEDWCYDTWEWDECKQLYLKWNYCDPVCGYHYAETADAPMNDEHWKTCEDLDIFSCMRENDQCISDVDYDHCLGAYSQQNRCSDENGFWYSYSRDMEDAWYIDYYDYDCYFDFDSLEGDDCFSDWIWESCFELYYQNDYCSDFSGAYIKYEGDDDEDARWVSFEEIQQWEKFEECY